MDYEPYKTSGTDNDFPPPHQNRMSGGGRISGNGRPAAMGSLSYSRTYDETDMEAKIHQLEQEAYSSVLRAFKAQADAITWEKGNLVTGLRKELRLSNEEHRDLLSRVNADETIRRIREWRQTGCLRLIMRSASQAVHGTDDDFPPPHQNRMSGGGCISGNGKPAAMGSMSYSRMYDATDMEAKIHQLEQEAYSSVLRAFKAQADAITWEKEGLIIELRKELRLSNEKHRDLLSKVNADETIQRIREWRQSSGLQPGMHSASQALHEPVPSPSISASRKKPKIGSSLPSQSFGGPSPSFHPQTMAAANQPSSSAAKRGPMMGEKGKKQKSIPPGASSMKMQYPSGPGGRGQFGNCISGGLPTEPAEGASFDPLVGRKVRTRWPDDNNFYEAVITDYNPVEGRHFLVYDMGTAHETYEWVNLLEISPEDIQWEGEDPRISHHGGYGGPGHGLNRPLGRDNAPGAGRGRGLAKGQSRKDFQPSQNGIGKKGPDDIQLLHIDTLIKEVERVLGANHPDPVEIEKAKKKLKEHEQALTDAIARIRPLFKRLQKICAL